MRADLAAMLAVPVLFALERLRPRRPKRRDQLERLVTNLAVGAAGALVMALGDSKAAKAAATLAEHQRWGLSRLPPGPLRTALALLWLDWTLYLWHRATHRFAPLWRLHLPHHLDPALDTSTAWRFHPAELLASVPFRFLQVLAAGVPRDALRLWQRLLFVSITFHHSNLKLPRRLERALELFVMTPHLHTLHHSARSEERDANWSSGLTLWDRLHGTFLDAAEPAALGVDGHPPAVSVVDALALR